MGKHSIRYIGPVIRFKLSGIHIKSSVTLASLKNHVRKVDIENLLRSEPTSVRSVTCVTLRIINEAGRVSEFVYLCLIF